MESVAASRQGCSFAGSFLEGSRSLATGARDLLPRLGLQQRANAPVILVARRTSLEVRPHPGNRGVGVGVGKLELDVAVELGEALLAGQLRALGTEEVPDQPVVATLGFATHDLLPRLLDGGPWRRGERAACASRREPSCTALRGWCRAARRERRSARRLLRRRAEPHAGVPTAPPPRPP